MNADTISSAPGFKDHPIVSRKEWLEARLKLLADEKEYTRARDRLAAQRRGLPWEKVDKNYVFASPDGPVPLADLFEGKSQLIVYHFMFDPAWDEGCPGCSFLCDHVDGARQHFEQRDVAFVAVSRGPLDKLQAYRKRMGWKFKWVSSANNTFNHDYGVSFTQEQTEAGTAIYNYEKIDQPGECPGISVFAKNEAGKIFHTYSTYGRGPEEMIGAFMLMDLTPKGRNEETTMNWVRRHDQYEAADKKSCCCGGG